MDRLGAGGPRLADSNGNGLPSGAGDGSRHSCERLIFSAHPATAFGISNIPLHPSLEQLSVQVALSEERFDDAIDTVFQYVEDVVRYLARSGESSPVKLIEDAFAPGCGPLTDRMAPAASQASMQSLFAEAFRNYRGDPSPRFVADTARAAVRVVLLCDLLTRELERIAGRLGTSLAQIPSSALRAPARRPDPGPLP